MSGGIPSPNPEYPQPIYNVTGNVNNKIENKNLLPFKNQDFTIKGINFKITNGKFIINGTATGEISSASTEFKENFSFMLSPGTYYFKKTSGINGYVRRYDNNVVIQQSQSSFTVTEKVKAYYGIYMANATSKSNEVNTDQVEVGSAFTVYEEHQEQNLPFTLEEGQRMYKDSYLSDDGIHNKMTHSTIDITAIVTLSNGNIGGVISLPNKTHKTDNYLLCNKVIFNNSRETGTIYENPVNCVIVGTPTDTFETMREKYNGSIIEYELENEEIEPYNETQASQYNAIKKAMSYNDQTNISSESDEVGMIIDATAVGDINKAISNLLSN